ncbi:MAG: hypothetical protein HY721_33915 [Planctomycetes bacterium]|nr:hypothetical protein [Planctomycetota bacterium]
MIAFVMRLFDRTRLPCRGLLLHALALPALLLLGAGCRGRAEFRRGEELFGEGRYREAYRSYWDACRLSPRAEHRDALRRAGRRAAESFCRAGRDQEAHGHLEQALESYALAAEYDPGCLEALDGYDRVWESLETHRSLEREMARATATGGSGLEEARRARDAALAGPWAPGRREALAEAVERCAARAVAPLRAATFGGPLSEDRAALLALQEGWGRLGAEAEELAREDEEGLFSPDREAREVASWGLAAPVLGPIGEEARGALAVVERALAALDERSRGAALEAAGDLAAALEAYARAAEGHPYHEAARSDRERVRARLAEESYQSAQVRCRAREWREALPHLEALLRHAPGHSGGLELLAIARRELAERHVAAARHFEDSGLPSNALVRYRMALELRRDDGALREAVRRLEEAIAARLRPRLRARLRAVDAEERRLRRELWGVDDEALSRLERTLEAAVQAELDSLAAGPPGRAPAGARPEAPLWIEDLDFSYPRGEPSSGVDRSRWIESYDMVPNPTLGAAAAVRDAVRERLARVEGAARAVPEPRRRYLEEEAVLLRRELEQAETVLASLEPTVPSVRWGVAAYPVVLVKSHADVAARYRLDGEDRWVSAALEAVDRVVEGDPARNVPPDPEEALSRAEALRILAPRLGAAIAADVGRLLATRDERYYREALDRIASGSFDVATENLVVFLCSRRGEDDPLVADAASRLKRLTGCDLPALWGE